MRILIISPTQSGIGGIAQHVEGFANFLKNNNNDVDIISSENTFTIPIKGLKNPSFMLSSFFKSKFQDDYDIVHAQNPISALAMKNIKAKKVLSLQGDFSQQISLLHGNTMGKISSKLEKNALLWADAITVPSKEMYDVFTKKGHKVFHVPNAINFSILPNGEERRYEKQIIFAGRLSEEKGILDLLQIIPKLSENIHLIIAGSGPEEQKVKDIEKKYDNVHFLGYIPKNQLIKLIRGSDLLIQPSIMEGGISSTFLESMYCKTPIIATSVGGNKEIILHMKNAYVVKPNSPSDIIQAIDFLFANPEKSQMLSENAFKIVSNYDWEHIGQKYTDIYQSLLS